MEDFNSEPLIHTLYICTLSDYMSRQNIFDWQQLQLQEWLI